MWLSSPAAPGTTSCLPNSRGAQNEWITWWSGVPSVLCAPPPSERSDRSIVTFAGITITSAVVIGPWSP